MNETTTESVEQEAPDISQMPAHEVAQQERREEVSERDHEKVLDRGAEVLGGVLDDYDSYVAERKDRIAYKNGDPAFDDANRKAARHERWSRVAEIENATQAALEATATRDRVAQEAEHFGIESVEDQIQSDWRQLGS